MDAQLTNTLLTSLATVATATLLGLGGVGIALMRKKLGIDETQSSMLAEKNMRDKLQATLVTAVGKYALGDKQGAVDYVIKEAGDTLAPLAVDPSKLSDLIVNKAAAWAGVPAVVAVSQDAVTTSLAQGLAPRA